MLRCRVGWLPGVFRERPRTACESICLCDLVCEQAKRLNICVAASVDWNSRNVGYRFERPNNNDYSTSGSALGSPYIGKLPRIWIHRNIILRPKP